MMERPTLKEKIEIQLLPPEVDFPPRNFKVCANVEVPGQKAIEKLEDEDRTKLGRKVSEIIIRNCPQLNEGVLLIVDGTREGWINVGIFTNNRADIHSLKEAPEIYPEFAFDVSDPQNPRLLPTKEWLKG